MTTLSFQMPPDGKLPIGIKETLARSLPVYAGRRMRFTFEEAKKQRTLKQNRFYFGPMINAVRLWLLDNGSVFSAADVHEYLWRNVLKETEIVAMPDGGIFERRLSSANSTTGDWEKRMDIIRAWAAERGLELPFPNEEAHA